MDRNQNDSFRVVVLDMQPIEPPIGGGRLRLLGLYHALGLNLPTTYIGSFDWPVSNRREHALSPNLMEIDVPLSNYHFKVNDQWTRFAQGRTIIDSTFGMMAHLSEEFLETARREVNGSDIVIVSHPWVYPAIRDCFNHASQVLVYDAHNVEGFLRTQLLDDGGFGSEIAKHVVVTEYELAHQADLILACSKEDRESFNEFYNIPYDKIHEIPNGVFSNSLIPPDACQKKHAQASLQLSGNSAIFLGSPYKPNIEAVDFIWSKLAPSLPNVTFTIVGGVGSMNEFTNLSSPPGNVRFVGPVTEEQKLQYLWAASIAINPMLSGSGTNIKMFDYMAAGLPIVTTPTGARGIENDDSFPVYLDSDINNFAQSTKLLISNSSLRLSLSVNARSLVEKKYSWEILSPQLGTTLTQMATRKLRTDKEKQVDLAKRDTSVVSTTCRKSHGLRDAERKIALLSPWGIRCGIAEYSRYLVQGFKHCNTSCTILAAEQNNNTDRLEELSLAGVDAQEIWQHGNIRATKVVQSCRDNNVEHVNIQYHPNFFSENSLIDIAKQCRNQNIVVTVTLHNTREADVELMTALSKVCDGLYVHDKNDLHRLENAGIQNLVHIPHGILEVPDEHIELVRRRLNVSNTVVVGTFGFLRAHKGLFELIQSIAILKDIFPDIMLYCLCALYPSQDSLDYKLKCEQLIDQLQIQDRITMDTTFMEIETVINNLHACDLIVLPYHTSNEGASGSAHISISSRRPVATSRQEIFSEIKHVTYQIENNTPPTLAAGMANILSSPMLLQSLRNKSEAYIKENSWVAVAEKYCKSIFTN